MDLLIGSHVSFNSKTSLLGSAELALEYGANAFMIYTGSNRSALRTQIDPVYTKLGHELMEKNNINKNNVIVHAPYIVNLANNTDIKKHNFYISFLRKEIDRCLELGLSKLVLHPGSHVSLDKNIALENIINGLDKVLDDKNGITILLEFMSGSGTEIGSSIEDLKYILDNTKNKDKLGVCLDTCHLNSAGINLEDFESFLDEFNSEIGIEKIKCIHVNDSYNGISSHKDRHANLGYGQIGFETLLKCIYNPKLKDIPKILETPWYEKNGIQLTPYKYEIQAIKNKKFIDFLNL